MKFVPTKKADHYFFFIFASYYLIASVLGFGYSSSRIISNGGEIPVRAIIHGALAGCWYFLFFAQVLLIILNKKNLHIKIGKVLIPLIIAVFISGIYVVLLRGPIPFEKVPFEAMGNEIGLFFIGVVYAVLGYIYRNNPHYHKRYLLYTIIILSGAGIVRFYSFLDITINHLVVIYAIPLLLIFVYDVIIYRKLFKATWIAFLIFLFHLFLLSQFFGMIADYLRPIMRG
ncbi:MAG: hypothetical protein CL530_03310 [Aequorivita sp.]|nr:hypothetical protein [Aequorivita sp.]|tara:strand:- start:29534 stop:30220 length:687 start_codon:yes stop_codon:yes gene_type:complete